MAKLRLTCPACQHALYVEQGVSEAWLTCPHCLTQVMNPWQQVAATPAPGPAPPESPRCPACGRDVDANWRFCPQCNAGLRGSNAIRTAGAELDVEIKRDTQGSSLGLGCFTVVGLLGFGLFVCGGGFHLVYYAPVVGVILFIAVLLALGFRVMWASSRPRETPAAPGARRGVAAVLSVVATAGIVYLGVVVSLILFLLVVCAQHIYR